MIVSLKLAMQDAWITTDTYSLEDDGVNCTASISCNTLPMCNKKLMVNRSAGDVLQSKLEELDIPAWAPRYNLPPDIYMLDGYSWKLDVITDDALTYHSEGKNAEPEQLEQLVSLLREALGMDLAPTQHPTATNTR